MTRTADGKLVDSDGVILGEERDIPRAYLLVKLNALYEANREKAKATRVYGAARKEVEEWLEANPGEELYDGETGVVARLRPSKGRPDLDTVNLPDKLLRFLADHKALDLNSTVWRGIVEKFPECLDVAKYIAPGPAPKPSLIVERKED